MISHESLKAQLFWQVLFKQYRKASLYLSQCIECFTSRIQEVQELCRGSRQSSLTGELKAGNWDGFAQVQAFFPNMCLFGNED